MANAKFFNILPQGNGRASLMLYGEIGGDVSPERVAAEMSWLASEYPMIDVHINSMGGEVFAGIAIFNALKDCPSIVNIYVDGLAASIAGIIALCGKPLHMSRFSRLMLHSVSGACKGGARDMRECADLIEGLEGTLADMISAKCGMPSEDVKKTYFDGKDHWFTADEARRAKLCDDIYDVADADSMGTAPTNEQVYQFVNKMYNPQKSNKMEFFDKLTALSCFKGLKTEDEVVNKVQSLENEAAKVEALNARIAELEAENKASKAAAIDAFLDRAVSEGRIKADQKDGYRKLMDADRATTEALINSMPVSSKGLINEYLKGAAGAEGAKDLASMSWDDIDKAERLGELKEKFPELYKAKFQEKFGK